MIDSKKCRHAVEASTGFISCALFPSTLKGNNACIYSYEEDRERLETLGMECPKFKEKAPPCVEAACCRNCAHTVKSNGFNCVKYDRLIERHYVCEGYEKRECNND